MADGGEREGLATRLIRSVKARLVGGESVPAPEGTRIPLGFSSREEFQSFSGRLRAGLNKSEWQDTKAFFRGSAVTGSSFKTGEAFSVESDFDLALAGSEPFEQAKQLGIGLRSGGTRTGPLTEVQLDALGLGEVRTELTEFMAGRDVSFMIYRDSEAVFARGPYIPVG